MTAELNTYSFRTNSEPNGSKVNEMVKPIGISLDEWLYEEVEKRRGDMNRSEFISQQLAKSFGFNDYEHKKEQAEARL